MVGACFSAVSVSGTSNKENVGICMGGGEFCRKETGIVKSQACSTCMKTQLFKVGMLFV